MPVEGPRTAEYDVTGTAVEFLQSEAQRVADNLFGPGQATVVIGTVTPEWKDDSGHIITWTAPVTASLGGHIGALPECPVCLSTTGLCHTGCPAP